MVQDVYMKLNIGLPLENLEYFNYIGSMITNGVRCIHEIKYRIAIEIAAFNKKRTLCTSKLDLNFRDKLVICYIWNIYWYFLLSKPSRFVTI
jgi:hypothetical protein